MGAMEIRGHVIGRAASIAAVALATLLLGTATSGAAATRGTHRSGHRATTMRLLVTPSIVRPGSDVTVRVIGSRAHCAVELIRSRHPVRVWKTKPHRTKLVFRSGSKSGALTVSAKCGRQMRIAPLWVVSAHHGRSVLLGYQPRVGTGRRGTDPRSIRADCGRRQ